MVLVEEEEDLRLADAVELEGFCAYPLLDEVVELALHLALPGVVEVGYGLDPIAVLGVLPDRPAATVAAVDHHPGGRYVLAVQRQSSAHYPGRPAGSTALEAGARRSRLEPPQPSARALASGEVAALWA